MGSDTDSGRGASIFRSAVTLILPAALLCGTSDAARATVIGSALPASFSVCEQAEDGNGFPRQECQAADLRFQPGVSGSSDFGFSMATGDVNGDGLADLVVGDPDRNRVYIFLGRPGAAAGYGLDPEDLADRQVSAETQADVILEPGPSTPNPILSFGFSVAVGRERVVGSCPSGGGGSALLAGAPAVTSSTPAQPGTVFYLPAGALCRAASNPPAPVTLDPAEVGQAFRAPIAEAGDEFGYSVAFGRLLTDTGDGEDVLVGARGALGGAGRVVALPVSEGVVDDDNGSAVKIEGTPGSGLGETLAVGDLDLDFDPEEAPFGGVDDVAIGAVGTGAGIVALVQGPLSPTDGANQDGVFRVDVDPRIQSILGEADGDYFGFSVAISSTGRLAVGAIYADNTLPASGGNNRTNVTTGTRLNGGKAYVWNPGPLDPGGPDSSADTANIVFVARRSGDQLGFGVAFGDVNGSGKDDLIITARREDGSGLKVDEIDQGTAYIVFDRTVPTSPVDLNLCAANSDCTGVARTDVMIFGGDRASDTGDEIGFALATGDLNGDGFDDVLFSSRTRQRVYAVTLADSDDDRATEGRNLRDDDDDNDGDPDSSDCAPLKASISHSATEIDCNGIDENCNGSADDAPDADGDGYDLCGSTGRPKDCDDHDPSSHPGAAEVCDGNDNACDGSIPPNELDTDADRYVGCSGWNDTQGDDPNIVGGGDCDTTRADTFPGAAPKEAEPAACRRDKDGDDYGDLALHPGVVPGTDCDDNSAVTYPGAATKESVPGACMKDNDGDDFGDRSPKTGVAKGTDCDDSDASSYPAAPERCDGNDNACDGSVPPGELDADGDHFVVCLGWSDVQGDDPAIVGGGDCAAADAATFPGAAPKEAFPTACMRDADGDDYGDIVQHPGVTAGTDCDDASATTFPGAAQVEGPLNCMKDADDDGYGDASASLPVAPGSDCADADAASHPGATEIPDDGIDQDCNGSDTVTCYIDDDLDGFGGLRPLLAADGNCTDPGESPVNTDCDDEDGRRSPGATEIPDDGIDQNCNGADTITCVEDADHDGAGTTLGTTVLAGDGSCDAAQGEAVTADDCDDGDASSHPGASEQCDGNDNDCNGSVPAGEADDDGDGFVECSGWQDTQGDNPGIVGGGDCDDAGRSTFPGAASRETIPTACRKDADGDDYGDQSVPPGVTRGTDCDDASAVTFPGAAQIEGPLNCMRDADDDGYGDATASLPVVRGTDCNDASSADFPGTTERCDGNDNACRGSVPAGEIDTDGDGYVACTDWNDTQGDNSGILGGGDCAPGDASTHPGAAPLEAVPTACMKDVDVDGYGDLAPPIGVTAGTDCDDSSAVTFPGAAQIEAPLNCMKDADDDGYGDGAAFLPIVAGADCDDARAAVNPGATEGPPGDSTCSDLVDNNCNGRVDAADTGCATGTLRDRDGTRANAPGTESRLSKRDHNRSSARKAPR